MKIALQYLPKEKRYCYKGEFPALMKILSNGCFKDGMGPEHSNKAWAHLTRIKLYTSCIVCMVESLATVCHRLDFQQVLYKQHKLSEELWKYYAAADIYLLFAKSTSVYDCICQVLVSASRIMVPGVTEQIPSFDLLCKYVKGNDIKLDNDIVTLFNNYDESSFKFDLDMSIASYTKRDAVKDGNGLIIFDLGARGDSSDNERPHILYASATDNDKNFKKFLFFIAYKMGNLIYDLEELSTLISRRLKFESPESRYYHMYHPGFQTMRTWIGQALIWC